MSLQFLADVIARHAVLVLLGMVVVMLILAAAFWRLLARYTPRGWEAATRAWNAFRDSTLAQRVRRLPGLGSLLTGTLTVIRYLGVLAVTGFIFAIVALVAFFEIADEIGFRESLADFDAALSAALHEHLSYETLHVFSLITALGNAKFLIVLGALVALILLLLRRWILAGAWMAATASGGLLNQLLKTIFERARPVHDHGLVTETSWSFPSGHASGSMLVYGLLGYLIVRHTPSVWRIPVALATVALIIFVGSSRVLLQVHYFSDVLAGYASGAAWLALCIAGLEAVRRRESGRA